jgi:HrpA-like RNA helicase
MASAKQRKGRAGRTKAGVCFHLFSHLRHASMRPFTESELLRTPLEEMCLMCKQLQLAPGGPDDESGIPAFLAKAMSAPHMKSVSNALELLVDLGAMEPETNNLTALGNCLAVLSLEPRVGKMVIWSYLLGCARVAANMAVAMSYKSPFILPHESQRRAADNAKVELSRRSESDQITIHHILEAMNKCNTPATLNAFCRRNFLGQSTIQMISDLKRNLSKELGTLGFPSPTAKNCNHNRHENDVALWQAAIAAGLYPNVAFRQRDDVNFKTITRQKLKVHVSSVNAIQGQPLSSKSKIQLGEMEFICFGEMMKGTKLFTANHTTHLESALPLLLMCGKSLCVRPVQNTLAMAILTLDDWVSFKCDADTAAGVVILRLRLESAFWHSIPDSSGNLSILTAMELDTVEIIGLILRSAHHCVSST